MARLFHIVEAASFFYIHLQEHVDAVYSLCDGNNQIKKDLSPVKQTDPFYIIKAYGLLF